MDIRLQVVYSELAYSEVEEWDWMARAFLFSGIQSDRNPRIHRRRGECGRKEATTTVSRSFSQAQRVVTDKLKRQ